LKWYIVIVTTVSVLIGYNTDIHSEKEGGGSMKLGIVWQRLVDEDGKTCQRCGGTEEQLSKGIENLTRALQPLGIKVTLEKNSMGAECTDSIIESNKILIHGRPLEEWLGAKVGTSECGFCCTKLGESVECRTTSVDGKTYEVIPAELIVKAGLKAASEIIVAPETDGCCEDGETSPEKNGRCCS